MSRKLSEKDVVSSNELNWCIDMINRIIGAGGLDGGCCIDLGSPYLSGNVDFGLVTDPLDPFEGSYDLGGV